MKFKLISGLALSFLLVAACSKSADSSSSFAPHNHLHIDPEMTAPEMIFAAKIDSPTNASASQDVAEPLKTGKRLYDWLSAINSARAVGQKISFTDPHTTIAYPIDHPSIYNPTLINSDYQQAMQNAPPEMRQVLSSTGELPNQTMGLSDDVFIEKGLAIARTYDKATRWVLVTPERAAYTLNQSADIRGYYFLSHTSDLNNKLNHLNQQSNAAEISQWLIGQCLNSQTQNFNRAKCEKAFAVAKRKGKVLAFYKQYLKQAHATYDYYFKLSPDLVRKDVTWTSRNPDVATIPFLRPGLDIFTKFLVSNVEDEFRKLNWQLKVNITDSSANDVSKMIFQPGIIDHVEHSLIVIDQNAPISEYLTQWAIRHEFGHILGFVDCYVEFYDENLQAMVNYQIDTTNLMCSRQGHFQQLHYDTLKAKYYKR